MRSSGIVLVGLSFTVAVGVACSSKSSSPPIDTAGTSTPSPGGSNGQAGGGDASTDGAASDDGGTVPNDAAGNLDGAACNALDCPGCCDSTGVNCLAGTEKSACGTNGSLCQDCNATGLSCTAGQCQ